MEGQKSNQTFRGGEGFDPRGGSGTLCVKLSILVMLRFSNKHHQTTDQALVSLSLSLIFFSSGAVVDWDRHQ